MERYSRGNMLLRYRLVKSSDVMKERGDNAIYDKWNEPPPSSIARSSWAASTCLLE